MCSLKMKRSISLLQLHNYIAALFVLLLNIFFSLHVKICCCQLIPVNAKNSFLSKQQESFLKRRALYTIQFMFI